jgi:stearoyl-CoA desaturase (Delta-9 desaturase)
VVINIVFAVILGLAITQAAMFATTVYLHRGLTHRALTVHPSLALLCRFFLWITTGMRPREWAAVHRRHHAATDTPEDPHSPVQHGFWRVQLANAALYRRVARDGVTVEKYARDIPADRFDRFMFNHAFLGLGIGIAFLIVFLGPWMGLLAAVVHAVGYLGLSGAVNAIGHTHGRRPNENSATNGTILALVTCGEGLHNNHHDRPTSARFSRRWNQIDLAWWGIRVLTWTRLVRLRAMTARGASS